MEQENKQQPRGWADVVITPDMPLGAIIEFLNILNSRLATVENFVTLTDDDGNVLTLTEVYQKQFEPKGE